MGARLLEESARLDILDAFFNAEFEGGRHQTRVEKISQPTT
jgi:ribose 5-phosphate isomerase B